MAMYLDSAALDDVAALADYPWVAGLTTNPALMAKALGRRHVTLDGLLDHLRALGKAGGGAIFVQVLSAHADDMVTQARAIHEALPERAVIKIPATPEGLKAISALSATTIVTAATAVYAPIQAYLAAAAGATYVIPYANRISRAGGDGIAVTEAIRRLLDRHGLWAQILVASIKSPEEAEALILAGAHHLTLPLGLLKAAASRDETREAEAEFLKALSLEGPPPT